MTQKEFEAGQAEVKAAQGYTIHRHTCSTCAHMTADVVTKQGVFRKEYHVLRNRRCGVGNFPVRPYATCRLWT